MYNNQATMYAPYDREKSRERSRDRDRRYPGRSPSEDSGAFQRKQRQYGKKKNKRVKQAYSKDNCKNQLCLNPIQQQSRFQGMDDIRVFKKQDEPTARGLTEEDIYKIKTEIEKEISKSYDFNWEHYKHRDALLQSNSMKEQKEKEKALSEKLMAARELISYFTPVKLGKIENIIEPGCESGEREGHTNRIHDILGCYYTHASQIPNQPQFEILNTNTTVQTKIIKFDNDLFADSLPASSKKNAESVRPLKGILKMPNSEPIQRGRSQNRQIDPQLIYLLKDFKINPQHYTKEKTEQLLKPYRDSGELDFLMRNKEVLEAMLKSTSSNPSSIQQGKPNYPINNQMQMPATINKDSAERSGSQQASGNPAYSHTFVPKADKFRTVPCKYFHSPQGCSKVDNCTFIHDQRYAGVSAPNGQPPSMQMGRQGPIMQPQSYAPPNPMYGYNMPQMNPMPQMGQNPNYYGHPMSYPPNPGYYQPQGQHQSQPQHQHQHQHQHQPYQSYPQMGKPNPPFLPNQPPPQQPPQPYGMSSVPPQQGYNSNLNYQYIIGNNPNK